jgi:hypothetical protein
VYELCGKRAIAEAPAVSDYPPMIATKGPTGGRATIAGILYQMLRSLSVGCDAVVTHLRSSAAGAEAILTLEPPAGDLRRESSVTVIEQIKMRRGVTPWSAGEIAEEVFPDLMKAVPDAGPQQQQLYRFTTDRAEGIDELRVYAAAMRGSSVENPAALDDADKCFRYGRVGHTAMGMFRRLANRAKAITADGERRLWAILRLFEIELVGESDLVKGVDRLLRILADDQDQVEFHRGKLLSDLFGLAESGSSLRMSDLLRRNGLDPDRLLHVARLPEILARQVRNDAAVLQYRGEEEARVVALRTVSPVSLFGGESGQGKTWALCRAALSDAAEGRLAVLLSARGSLAELEAEIVKRVWLPSYALAVPLTTVAKRLRPPLPGPDLYWLTVYLDDLHDRELARALVGAGWGDLGIRLVLSAQPQIERLLQEIWQVTVYSVPDFSLPELRTFLERAGRDPSRIPDDVLDWLARPILAATFVRVPETRSWSDPNEYRLIEAYWSFATLRYRDQPVHKSDSEALKALTSTLLDILPAYPFPTRLRMKHLNDEAVRRLVLVGLVREDDTGLAFAHDRLLNWALAQAIVDRIVDETVDPLALEALLRRGQDLRTSQGDPLGNRLGYLLLDIVWGLAQASRPGFLAEFLLQHAREITKRTGEESFLGHNLATIGASIVPAIRRITESPLDGTNEWIWPGYLARALRRIGRGDPDAVRSEILPMLNAPGDAQRRFAVNVLRTVPAPASLDRLLEIHLEHARILDLKDTNGDFASHYADHQMSFGALVTAAKVRPQWIAERADAAEDRKVLEQLLWLLLNIDYRDALPLWHHFKAKFFTHLDAASRAALRAIRDFLDFDEIDRLETPLADPDGTSIAMQVDGLARLAPARAAERIAKIDLDDLWGTSSWWLDGLVHRLGPNIAAALRPRERVKYDPFNVSRQLLEPRIELLDTGTLDIFLDEFEARLGDPVEEGKDPLELQWRSLRFFAMLCTSEQIACVHRRRGTALETRLAASACARAGRTSRVKDRLGDDTRTMLAMMAGAGFDQLAVAELRRENRPGSEDGLLTALWSDAPEVAAALEQYPSPDEDDRYPQVLLHNALAAHRADRRLGTQLEAGAPIFNQAVEIRRSRGAMGDAETETYLAHLRTGTLDQAKQAVRMAAFAGRKDLLAAIVDAILERESEPLLDEAVGVFRFNQIYDPRLLPLLAKRLATDERGAFTAGYLAMHGDAAARQTILEWLAGLPDGELGHGEFMVVDELLDHPDCADAALAFLQRRMSGRRRERYAGMLIRLAESGDVEAREAVHSLAFRSPDQWSDHPIHAIRFLGETAPNEAYAAAERLFIRHQDAAAAHAMLELDSAFALPTLLAAYADARTELRWWLARLMRWGAPHGEYRAILSAKASSERQEERVQAAELAGWLPHDEALPFLESLAEDPVRDVELAALAALRRRNMEASAASLMTQLAGVPRPLAWVRLNAIIRLVDPHILGRRADPLWLRPVLDALPAEFGKEAKSGIETAKKKVREEAKKRDKDRLFY